MEGTGLDQHTFLFGNQESSSSSSQELIDEPPDEKEHRRDEILRRFAFHQFTQHRFDESLKNYLQIKEGWL